MASANDLERRLGWNVGLGYATAGRSAPHTAGHPAYRLSVQTFHPAASVGGNCLSRNARDTRPPDRYGRRYAEPKNHFGYRCLSWRGPYCDPVVAIGLSRSLSGFSDSKNSPKRRH